MHKVLECINKNCINLSRGLFLTNSHKFLAHKNVAVQYTQQHCTYPVVPTINIPNYVVYSGLP